MNKMLEETIKTIKCHPDTQYTFNEYWDIDNFRLKLNETNSIVVSQQNKCNRIDVTYWYHDEHSRGYCLQWDEDECVVGRSYSNDKTKIDPELAYFQIMTDIQENENKQTAQ